MKREGAWFWVLALVFAVVVCAAGGYFVYTMYPPRKDKGMVQRTLRENKELSGSEDDVLFRDDHSVRGYFAGIEGNEMILLARGDTEVRMGVDSRTVYTCQQRFFEGSDGVTRDALKGYLDYSRYNAPDYKSVSQNRVGFVGRNLFLSRVQPGQAVTGILDRNDKSLLREVIYHSVEACDF